jgi:hypothetical protein
MVSFSCFFQIIEGKGRDSAFASLAPRASDEAFSSILMDFLRSLGVNHFRAPYRAWSQLGYLLQHNHIDAGN